MAECTIPALLAAIELLTAGPPDVVLTVATVCDHNPVSSACYEMRAREARAAEEEYRRVVTDVVAACQESLAEPDRDSTWGMPVDSWPDDEVFLYAD